MTGATEDDVGVALQFLDDFLRLKVPDVNLVVFAAADDPFASGDGKAGENAVFLIFVTLIRLQAFPLGVIPQLERVVQSRGENI